MLSLIVAILAPLITSFQLLPQLYQIYKTKNVKDVSIHSLSLFLLTNVLWFMHGYFISDYSLIVGSTIGMIISILSLLLHVKYSK